MADLEIFGKWSKSITKHAPILPIIMPLDFLMSRKLKYEILSGLGNFWQNQIFGVGSRGEAPQGGSYPIFFSAAWIAACPFSYTLTFGRLPTS